MRTEYVVISIIMMLVVLLVVIGFLTGVIPGFDDFIRNISESPWGQ
jgi:type II secretory pathway component PulF